MTNKHCGTGYCGECGKENTVYAQSISWDYTAPNGKSATHHEGIIFLSTCCDAPVYTDEALMVEFENTDCEGEE